MKNQIEGGTLSPKEILDKELDYLARRQFELEGELLEAQARIQDLEQENAGLMEGFTKDGESAREWCCGNFKAAQQLRIDELEEAIRDHRDRKADDRCWMDDQELYNVLDDGDLGDNRVGSKEEMLENCKRFINNRCEGGGWPSYAELEQKLKETEAELALSLEHSCGYD